MIAGRRSLLPRPLDSEDQNSRFHHRDLACLTADDLTAEQTIVDYAISERVFTKSRPVMVAVDADGEIVDDIAWLRQRRDRLANELRRRKGRKA